MRRILLVLATVAVMAALAAPNALAQKKSNYGDCVSFVAATDLSGVDVKSFTKATAPLQSQGEGNADQISFGCPGLPPGQ